MEKKSTSEKYDLSEEDTWNCQAPADMCIDLHLENSMKKSDIIVACGRKVQSLCGPKACVL